MKKNLKLSLIVLMGLISVMIGYYVINKIKLKNIAKCEELWNLSTVQLTSQERMELRSLEPDHQKVRALLVAIHQEKLNFWIDLLNRNREAQTKLFSEGIETLLYNTDLSKRLNEERQHNARQIDLFNASIKLIKTYKFGTNENDKKIIYSQFLKENQTMMREMEKMLEELKQFNDIRSDILSGGAAGVAPKKAKPQG